MNGSLGLYISTFLAILIVSEICLGCSSRRGIRAFFPDMQTKPAKP